MILISFIIQKLEQGHMACMKGAGSGDVVLCGTNSVLGSGVRIGV